MASVANTVLKNDIPDVEALLDVKLDGSDRTVRENLQDKILAIGENLKIRRFEKRCGIASMYIHGGGTVGVMVNFETDDNTAKTELFATMGKDVAMQIAAMSPLYLDGPSVPEDVVAKEKEILAAQLNEDDKMKGKPEKVLEGIIAGKIGKFYKEVCLLEQQFVKNGDLTVAKYIESVAQELGTSIKVTGFVRFAKGEGLQKREDNFADEVAGMIK